MLNDVCQDAKLVNSATVSEEDLVIIAKEGPISTALQRIRNVYGAGSFSQFGYGNFKQFVQRHGLA